MVLAEPRAGTVRPGYPRPRMRRIERLINLIAALLESRRPMTADEIRTRIQGYEQGSFEAFRRAFERDKEALRAMGIPIEVVATDPLADQADGYIIPKDKYYLPDIDFEPDELAALRIAADAVLGSGEEVGTGLLKLGVDEGLAGGRLGAGGRLAWSADVASEREALEAVYAAVLERTQVSFDYQSASGESSRRSVEPYGVVQRRGHWYLVGNDATAEDIRTFRVSRIDRVEAGTGTFAVPEGFAASEYVVRQGWEAGEEATAATVRFEPSLAWWVEQNLPSYPSKKRRGGAVDVELPVSNPDAFVSWVLEFGENASMLKPDELRDRLLERIAPYLKPVS